MKIQLYLIIPSIRFDKTPRYISNLENISNKINIPVIATCKSIQSIVWSDYKGQNLLVLMILKDF